MDEQYVTVSEAQFMLGVSKATIAGMIKTHKIEAIPNTLDARSKLIRVQDIQALLAQGRRPPPKRKRKRSTPKAAK